MKRRRKRRSDGPWLGVLPSVVQPPAGGLERLNEQAEAAVAAQAAFVPTAQTPYPSAGAGKETDDLAAHRDEPLSQALATFRLPSSQGDVQGFTTENRR